MTYVKRSLKTDQNKAWVVPCMSYLQIYR